MGKNLIIAEKPSVASDIARALGGFKKAGDYFESDSALVSSAIGHLVELAAPEGVEVKRGKWNLENLPVLPEYFDLKPIEKTETRFKLLKKLIKRPDVDVLINACDAGREGELIFRNLVKLSGSEKPIQRLWLQSMTTQAIRSAFERLRSGEELRPLADAAVSRSESDWLVGINSTRALTAFNSRHVGGFQKTTAGRVQTPTLAILVEREEKIRAFKPRTYWEVFADFGVAAGSYRGRWFDEQFKKGVEDDTRAERIWERARAEQIEQKCRGKTGIVTDEKKPQTQSPPLLYDLTTLQREANSRFGLSAGRTLQIAQALYERHKVLTYPRTDSRYLPEDYLGTSRNILAGLADPSLSRHAAKALENGWVHPNKRIFNDAKVSDHFAIVPTGVAPRELDEMQAKIYDMVARRFIAVFFPQAEFELTTRITTVEGEKFKTEGKIIIKPGWLEVYDRQMESESIIAVTEGETARVDAIEVKESETKPPPRFNEATLLSAMEGAGKMVDDEELREAMREKGLGTPATRAAIIEGLIFEGYVERKQRDLIATAKGISLITLLRNVRAETLCKPEMTGEWEFKLKQMERGQLSRDEFMHQIRGLTREIVEKVKGFGEKPIVGEFATLEIACPQCGGGPFKEDYRTYTCASCSLRVWKSMAGREFEPGEVTELLTKGRVGPLEGFRSKMGRAFSAIVTLGKDHKPQFEFDNGNGNSASDEAVDLTTLTPLAPCPVCHAGQVYELEKAYACENNLHKQPGRTCELRISKVILQKSISPDQMRKLLTEGKTGLIAGFVSKKGKARPFSAFLTLNDKGKIGWEFPPRESKRKRPAPPDTPPGVS
ncbi:MAG: DNA topoisomerase III [Chthoniobacteraceae bacterium]|jgi:DNA topoisomerase-3